MRLRELQVVAWLEGERRLLADAAHLDSVFLGVPVGNRRVGRVRHACQQLLAPLRRLLELGLDLLQCPLQPLEALELLRRRLAARLRLGAQLAGLGLQLAPPRIGLHQLVEGLRRPLAGEGPAEALGVGPRGPEVDQPFVR